MSDHAGALTAPSDEAIAPARPLGYQPSLDGLRGLAVIAVMGYHYGYFEGGSAGVTVFFALSGFLITCLLLEEFDEAGRISFRNFYARRGLRLLPALFAVLFVDVVFVMFCRTGWIRKADLAAAVVTLLYSSNWVAAFQWLPLHQLGHTWSLSVEEQFYLLWPLLVLFLARWDLNRWTLVALLTIVAACFAGERFVLAGLGAAETRLFYGLDTRADALLFGAAASVVYRSRLIAPRSRHARVIDWVGIAALIALVSHLFFGVGAVSRSTSAMSLGGYTAVALLATVLILALAGGSPLGGRLQAALGVPPLRFVGRVSYGLYLWHPLVSALVNQTKLFESPSLLTAVNVTVTVIVTLASYYLIEKPCLRLKQAFGRRRESAAPAPSVKAVEAWQT